MAANPVRIVRWLRNQFRGNRPPSARPQTWTQEEILTVAPTLDVRAHAYPPRYAGLEQVPDRELYRPSEHGDWLFSPWQGQAGVREYVEAAVHYSAISRERLYVLLTLARQALPLAGDFIECGVWRGGSAVLFSKLLHAESPVPGRKLYLLDTFRGLPPTDPRFDTYYKGGEFADTSLEQVRERLPHKEFVEFRPGFIPATFAGLEDAQLAFAHVDVDIYQSILDCCAFLYPRVVVGGIMVFDDYAWSTCPGARRAVDEFFQPRKARPLVLSNGQAVVFKSAPED